MLLGSFVAEMSKLIRRPAIWVLLAVWAALGVFFGYVLVYLLYTNPSDDMSPADRAALLDAILPSAVLENVISGFPLFGGAMILIVGALSVGSEYGWGTLSTILTQRPGRLLILGGKLLALALAAVVFELAVIVPGAISSYLIAQAEDAPVDWPAIGEVVEALAAGWLILAMWVAVGVLLAVLFRGTAVPIGLGLVYLLVIEGLIRGFAGQSDVIAAIEQALPGANAGSLAAAFITIEDMETPGVTEVVGANQAMIVLIGYAVAFVVIAGQLFRRRDVA